ncbi:MAG: S24 family peptidase [Rikenellaceae bacterium]
MKITSWQRIEKLLEYTRLNTNAFAKSIQLKRSENLYQIKKGNNGISKELANLINEKYPEVNKLWLLTGEGNMLLSEVVMSPNNQHTRCAATKIPYYDLDILSVAGKEIGIYPNSYYEVPMAGNCDFAIKYNSDKMSPVIESGSIVFVKEVDKKLILPGEIYLVLTKSYATIRYVDYLSDEHKIISLRSQSQKDSVNIHFEDIDALFVVKGVYRPFL